jgi:hypothetical protein
VSRRTALAGVVALVVTCSASAEAEPQLNVGLVPGLAWSQPHPTFGFYGAVHADVLFGRVSNQQVGLGPSLDVASLAFQDLRLAPGLSVQLPRSIVDVTFTAGPLLRIHDGFRMGASGRAFIGSRAFNYYGSYAPALGLVIGGDVCFDGRPSTSLFVGAHIDAEYFAIPWIVLFGWLRGPSR